MRSLIVLAVVLAGLGMVAGLTLAMAHQSTMLSASVGTPDVRAQAPGMVLPGQEAGYPCPPIGTEGPPERDLPESVRCADPADPVPAYCP